MSQSSNTSKRSVFLLKFRNNERQRHHLAAFIPNEKYAGVNLEDNHVRSTTACKGHLIHIIGLPISGYALELVTNFSTLESKTLKAAPKIADVASNLVVDPPADPEDRISRTTPTVGDTLEKVAMSLPAPRPFRNLLGPVDDVNNRDCQSWMDDYISLLVKSGYLPATAHEKVKAEKDPGDLGTKLKKVEPNTGTTATGGRAQATPPRATPSPAQATPSRATPSRATPSPAQATPSKATPSRATPSRATPSPAQATPPRATPSPNADQAAKAAATRAAAAKAAAASTSQPTSTGWQQEPGTNKWRKWDAVGKKWIYQQ